MGDSLRAARSTAACTLAVSIMLIASGCTADQRSDPTSGSSDGTVALPDKNIEQWVLPLDEFVLSDKQLKKQGYAAALLISDCLEEKGIEDPVPYVDFDTAYGERNLVRSELTPGLAELLGYHLPQEWTPPDIVAWERFRTRPVPKSLEDQMRQCSEKLDDAFPKYSNKALNFTSAFAVAAFQGALADPDVEGSIAGWRTCMAPQGIEDLPADPQGMPSESIISRFHSAGGLDGAGLGPVTPAEIKLALVDVQCRNSSGYQKGLYDAVWKREARLLEENQSALEAIRTSIKKKDAEIDATIAKYATSGAG